MCNRHFKKLMKAHIYPSSLYTALKLPQPDANGQMRIHMARFDNTSYRQKKQGIPTGLYDEEILCIACDNSLNEKYESDAKRMLFDPARTIFNFQEEIGVFHNLDYALVKPFFLSMFYKASISQQMPGIKLGRALESRLRDMLVNNDPGASVEFALHFLHFNDHEVTFQYLSNIRFMATRTNIRYSFIAGGVLVSMFPRSDAIPPVIKAGLLDPQRPLAILKLPVGRSAEMFDTFYQTDSFSRSGVMKLR